MPTALKVLLEIREKPQVEPPFCHVLLYTYSLCLSLTVSVSVYSSLDYKNAALGILPSNEVQIYTWPDATLREIADLLKDVIVPNQGKQRNSQFDISLVYPNRDGEYKLRPVSLLLPPVLSHLSLQVARVRLNRDGPDDKKCLAELKFETGDYLDLAVLSSHAPSTGGGRFPHDRAGAGA
jgi:hypothetical protein